jgi:hypothetical protein
MSWRLMFRALWLRGGIVWLVTSRYRVMPRRLLGPRFRWVVKAHAKRQGRSDGKLGLPTAEQMRGRIRVEVATLTAAKGYL